MKLSNRELATVLAALRLYQEHEPGEIRTEIVEIADNGGTVVPLSNDEIDDLCESLNLGPKVSKAPKTPSKLIPVPVPGLPGAFDLVVQAHILVSVEGGVAEVVDSTVPPGIEVEIVDFDNLKEDGSTTMARLSPEAQAYAKEQLV